MADEENQDAQTDEQAPKSNLPILLGVGGGLVIVVLIALFFMMSGDDSGVAEAVPPGEYVVEERMYQLKDGSYLRFAFNIQVDEDKVDTVAGIITEEAPGVLPHGINSILGNKTRDDLISGEHNREAFAREIKKLLDEQVFSEYNKQQDDPQDMIEVRKILITDFVTQSG